MERIYFSLIRFPRLFHVLESLRSLNRRKIAFVVRFLRRLTGKRLFNLLRVEYNYRLKRPINPGYPYRLVIDPTNLCNLRCPLCPTGLGKSGRPKGMMSLEDFKRIVDVLAEHALGIILYNWGEPFINGQVYEMIRYASKRKLSTFVSTNLTLLTEDDARRIVDSELDHLRLSIDGVSQEVYSVYRRGGDLHRVLRNVQLLLETRDKMGALHPVVDWFFIVMRHNEHEMFDAWRLARQIGVDSIYFAKVLPVNSFDTMELPFLGKEDTLALQWLPALSAFRPDLSKTYLNRGTCPWLWKSVVVNYDGTISPCCYVDDRSTDMGNLLEQPFAEIWNNTMYLLARRAFRPGNNDPEVQSILCWRCNIYEKP
jgi:radical SAM protein with 4Fe4S-binding SPASM domain